jgi:hypothetical protein
MAWNYSGDPLLNDRDKVRFLVGDTCEKDALVSDEEIAYALSKQAAHELAAAIVLRALAAKYSRIGSVSVGDVSKSADGIAAAFSARAKELDPNGVTTAVGYFVLPSFGGLSIPSKQTLDDDTDAVQPSFRRGMNDIPGGPDDSDAEGSDLIS